MGHRLGRSADLNVGITVPSCLTCDSIQDEPGCENKYSTDQITIKNWDDGTIETLTVKAWIDRLASGRFGLTEGHKTGRRIHLEM